MFSICTAIIEPGKIEETLAQWKESEKLFGEKIGVTERYFFQSLFQPHIVWSLTGWVSEKHHNDAAQSIMKTRRDDRIASAPYDKPYFEIFAEQDSLSFGSPDGCGLVVVVAHGLISSKARDRYLELRAERAAGMKGKLPWFGLYQNTYNPDEFVSYLGFPDRVAYDGVRQSGNMTLEEYLFAGLQDPMGMSLLAGYNQFVCAPILRREGK